MKIIALILSLNILVATNGIAISEHFCSKMGQPNKDLSGDLKNDDNCCHTNYIGFEKQDIEGNIASSIILKKVHQNLTLYYSCNVLGLKNDFQGRVKIEYPPPLQHLSSKPESSNLQVFRC